MNILLLLFSFIAGAGFVAAFFYLLLRERQRHIDQLKLECEKLSSGNNAIRQSLDEKTQKLVEMNTTLVQERKYTQEKLQLLEENKQQLKMEFQHLAQQIFEEKGKQFTEQNHQQLNQLVSPLREQLSEFKKRVEDVYDKETRDRVSLHKEILHLKDLNQRISQEAINLTQALKGDSRVRGNWGEIILERVLEDSGLQKGREYEIQQSLDDDEGKRYRPDVIVRLPEGKDVVIDSKVSLAAYERYYSAADEQASQQAFKEHIVSLKAHYQSLAAKNYSQLKGIRSLDFVLMFVPIEAAFLAALQNEPQLFNQAFEKNIIMVSPSTLLATLRTIHNIWRYEYQSQNAQKIAQRAGDLYDKFYGFVESLQEIGKHLDKAQQSYSTAHNRLVTGHGNLISRAEHLKELGVSSKKELKAIAFESDEPVA